MKNTLEKAACVQMGRQCGEKGTGLGADRPGFES